VYTFTCALHNRQERTNGRLEQSRAEPLRSRRNLVADVAMPQPSPRTIFIIRHGEKPETPPPYGTDVDGNQSPHSLLPRGWQRAGALATLFAPPGGNLRTGIATPNELLSPDYGGRAKTAKHRTYQTLSALNELVGIEIESTHSEGDEANLGRALAATRSGITLVCWEHKAIPTIANNIGPVAPGTIIPQKWPGERFDLVWSFTLNTDTETYVFNQLPQLLLAGDGAMTISF
jgi:hypothetical protein